MFRYFHNIILVLSVLERGCARIERWICLGGFNNICLGRPRHMRADGRPGAQCFFLAPKQLTA